MRYLIIISLLLNACGMADKLPSETDDAKTATEEQTDDQGETGEHVDVAVSVDVQVTVIQGSAGRILYRATPRYYYEAERLTPDGYRIPTRGELLELYARGDLGEIVADGQLWTSTETDTGGQRVLDIGSGQVIVGHRVHEFQTIYIAE